MYQGAWWAAVLLIIVAGTGAHPAVAQEACSQPGIVCKQEASGQPFFESMCERYPDGVLRLRFLGKPCTPVPQSRLPASNEPATGGDVHPLWNCVSSSRSGSNYDRSEFLRCLGLTLPSDQMERFRTCLGTSSRQSDYTRCYDQVR